MNKQEIYEKMIAWQMDAGEDFLDYFDSDLNGINFMFWARGKGYITVEQLNLWEVAIDINDSALYASTYVHDCYGEGVPYAIVSEEDWTEEGQEKAFGILAEFISESITYIKRFKVFLEEN